MVNSKNRIHWGNFLVTITNENRLEGFLSVKQYPSTRIIFGFNKLDHVKRLNKILFKELDNEQSLFERAIRDNCYKLVEYMLQNGADATMNCKVKIDNKICDRETPTLAACSFADLNTFKLLVKHGGTYEPAEIAWIKMNHLGNLLLNKQKNSNDNLLSDTYDNFIEKEQEFVDYIYLKHNLTLFSTTKSNKNLREIYLYFKNQNIDLNIKENDSNLKLDDSKQ